jgi:hypothetical protein
MADLYYSLPKCVSKKATKQRSKMVDSTYSTWHLHDKKRKALVQRCDCNHNLWPETVIVSAVSVSGTTVWVVSQGTTLGLLYGVYLEHPLCVYCNVVPVGLHPLLHSLPYPYLLVPCDTFPGLQASLIETQGCNRNHPSASADTFVQSQMYHYVYRHMFW